MIKLFQITHWKLTQRTLYYVRCVFLTNAVVSYTRYLQRAIKRERQFWEGSRATRRRRGRGTTSGICKWRISQPKPTNHILNRVPALAGRSKASGVSAYQEAFNEWPIQLNTIYNRSRIDRLFTHTAQVGYSKWY